MFRCFVFQLSLFLVILIHEEGITGEFVICIERVKISMQLRDTYAFSLGVRLIYEAIC